MRDTTRLERRTVVLDGEHAQLRLEDGHITIRTHAPTQRRPVTVTVSLDQVRGATMDRPSRGRPGWFHLAVVGGSVPPASALAASVDPYAIPLSGREFGPAKRLVRLIADHVRNRGLPPEPQDEFPGTSPGVTVTTSPPPDPPRAADGGGHAHDDPGGDHDRGGDVDPAGGGDPAEARDPAGDPDAQSHLDELADLHRAGVLTDEEYARACTRVADAHRGGRG